MSHLGGGERGAIILKGLAGRWSLDVEGNHHFLTQWNALVYFAVEAHKWYQQS